MLEFFNGQRKVGRCSAKAEKERTVTSSRSPVLTFDELGKEKGKRATLVENAPGTERRKVLKPWSDQKGFLHPRGEKREKDWPGRCTPGVVDALRSQKRRGESAIPDKGPLRRAKEEGRSVHPGSIRVDRSEHT